MGMYQRMYLLLFNAVTDAIELLQRDDFAAAAETLVMAQKETEEIYIQSGEPE